MTDVHEVYDERRRWRIWPIVLLVLVAMFGIAVLVAMIMNIHGSITWPAGEVKFGFWPKATETIAIAPAARVATEIPSPAPAPQVQSAAPSAQPAQLESRPLPPPAESNTAPEESAPQ